MNKYIRGLKANKVWIYILAICGILFLLLGILDKEKLFDGLNNFVRISVISLETPLLTMVSKVISIIGEWYFYLIIALGLVIIPKTRRIGLPVFLGLILFIGGAGIFKEIFSIPRPSNPGLMVETGFGFPSGHSTYGLGFILLLIYVVLKESKKLFKKRTTCIILIISIIYIGIIGFSRLYLGVHNFTDVIGGYLLGIAILSFSIVAYKTYLNKRKNQ